MMIVTLFVVAIVNVATESLYERRDAVTALDYKKKSLERSLSKVQTLTALVQEPYVVFSFSLHRMVTSYLHCLTGL
jgi:hypothetical protein